MGGSSPNSDLYFFFENLCCFHVSKCLKKKIDKGVGGCGMTNPSFSRINGFFIILTRPLSKIINPNVLEAFL